MSEKPIRSLRDFSPKPFKITLKQFNNYQNLKKDNSMGFPIDDDDVFLKDKYGLTYGQLKTLLRLDKMFSFHDRTIKEINEIIADWA